MSCTNVTAKISPVGTGINKSLLTPCRRIGLSRKRKTPSSILKCYSENVNSNSEYSPQTTPVNHGKPFRKKKGPLNFQATQSTELQDATEETEMETNVKDFQECTNNFIKKKSQKELFQTFSSEDIIDCNDLPPTKIKKEEPSKTIKEQDCANNFVKKKSKKELFQTFSSEDVIDCNDLPPTKIKKEQSSKTTKEQECANNFVKKKSNKGLFQTFSSEDIFDCNDLPPTKIKKKESSKTIKENDNILLNNQNSSLKLSVKLPTDELINSTHLTNSGNDCVLKNNTSEDLMEVTNISKNESSTQKTMEKLDCNNEVMIVSDSDEDFERVSKHSRKQKPQKMQRKNEKQIRKSLSIKKSVSITDDEFNVAKCEKPLDILKECKIQIQKLQEPVAYPSENIRDSIEMSVADSIRLDNEDDAFTSTPEQEGVKKKDIIQKIKTLENLINQKRLYLTNLKQASIYKNKHNIESLKQLTTNWISGCVLGLNDLLKQLQAHGPISMTTLLNNLHISSEIASKLSLNAE